MPRMEDVAGTIRIRTDCVLRHRSNLREPVQDIEFAAGTPLQVLHGWDAAWLVKDSAGRLFNVKKELAEPQ